MRDLKPYYPAPTESVEQALTRQNATISHFIRNSVHRGSSSSANRKSGRRPSRLLLTGSQGSGKTMATLRELARETAALRKETKFVAHILVPTIAKAEEIEEEYKALAVAGSLPIMVIRGRTAQDPKSLNGSPMCLRPKVVSSAAASGVSMRRLICGSCPLSSQCGSMRQAREIAAVGSRVIRAMAHSYGFLHMPFSAANLNIIDESITLKAIDEVTEMSASSFKDAAMRTAGLVKGEQDFLSDMLLLEKYLWEPNSLLRLQENGLRIDRLKSVRKVILRAIRRSRPSLNGKMTDQDVVAALGKYKVTDLKSLVKIVDAVIREIKILRVSFTGITLSLDQRIQVHSLRHPVSIGKRSALLLIDGTGSLMLNGILFGDLERVHIPVERRAFVIGTEFKSYSTQSYTGLTADDKPIRPDEAEKLRRDSKTIVKVAAELSRGDVLVVAQLRAAKIFRQEDFLPESNIAHFGQVRGINRWKDCASAVIFGRESVSINRLEDMARAFFAGDVEPFVSCFGPGAAEWSSRWWPKKETRGRRMRDGSAEAVEVDVHPDRRAQELLEQLREAEVVQAADRCRPIFQYRLIVLCNELCNDITYDRVWRHADLVAGGNRFDKAWRRSGVVPLGATGLSRAHPALFRTESAAREALRTFGNNGGVTQIIRYLGTPPIFSYRLPGQRGLSSRALIDCRHPHPRVALEEALASGVEDFHAEK